MALQRISWLLIVALVSVFWWWRTIVAPLHWFSFQSDPELTYIFSSALLANGSLVDHTDHPGTALQWVGALIARAQGITLASVLEPDALQRFLFSWRLLALASALGTTWLLARRWRENAASVGLIAALGFALDYQMLVYWPTFTPESAFVVIYLPVALVCVLHTGEWSLRRWLTTAVAMGIVTTIKLTLWPITLFVAAGIAFSGSPRRRALGRFAVFVAITFGSYVTAAAITARDPLAQWRWIAALLGNAGRYGSARAEGGVFPPFSVGLDALRHGLAFQSYSLIPAALIVLVLAVASLRRAARARNRAEAIWSGAFLGGAALSLLLFFKHPYQFKYLLPLSLLAAIYLSRSSLAIPPSASRWLWGAVALLAFVALNAVATQILLYEHVIARDRRVQERIDQWRTRVPHDVIVFSSGLPHPVAALKYTVPMTGELAREFERRFGRVELAPTRIADFHRITPSELPVPTGARRPLVFLTSPLADAGWQCLDAVEDDRVYVYTLAHEAVATRSPAIESSARD